MGSTYYLSRYLKHTFKSSTFSKRSTCFWGYIDQRISNAVPMYSQLLVAKSSSQIESFSHDTHIIWYLRTCFACRKSGLLKTYFRFNTVVDLNNFPISQFMLRNLAAKFFFSSPATKWGGGVKGRAPKKTFLKLILD